MSLNAGDRLGPYEVGSLLGEGGTQSRHIYEPRFTAFDLRLSALTVPQRAKVCGYPETVVSNNLSAP